MIQTDGKFRLAISPCPNDTFAFYGLLHGKVPYSRDLQTEYMDIEALNLQCMRHRFDFCKISFSAFLPLSRDYVMLDSGAALGFGCGPLIVAKETFPLQELSTRKIAIPGKNTTACLLLKLFAGKSLHTVEMPFDHIMDAVNRGDVDAGLIIHESRFTYRSMGLIELVDLGAWWEQKTGAAIPLGGIVARRTLPVDSILEFQQALTRSIDYAWNHPDEVVPFMKEHAQEIDREVMLQHVNLYVNEFTRSLGPAGEKSVRMLFAESVVAGLIEDRVEALFVHEMER
ncbi:MAG: 1,4-dihydroxy-6-naphthoate synthase [Acidobacteria bacterium]|nr:MAG: 1,4-dihydroxy-6-naphthoate synthase [Acidobacteriota bacterium]